MKITRSPGVGGAQSFRATSGVYLYIRDGKTYVQSRPRQPYRMTDVAQYNRDLMRVLVEMTKYTVPEEIANAHEWQKGSNDTWRDALIRASVGTLYQVITPEGETMVPADHGFQPEPTPEPTDMPWTVVKEWSFAVDGATNAIDYVLAAGETELVIIRDEVGTSANSLSSIAVSTDGGTTYRTTLGDYRTWQTNGVPGNQIGFPIPETNTTAQLSNVTWLLGLNLGNRRVVQHMTSAFVGGAMFIQSNSPVNAVRIKTSAGNFNSGRFTILAR